MCVPTVIFVFCRGLWVFQIAPKASENKHFQNHTFSGSVRIGEPEYRLHQCFGN